MPVAKADLSFIPRSQVGPYGFRVSKRLDRGLVRFGLLIMALTGLLAVIIAAVIFFSRLGSLPAAQQQLLEWQRACQAGLAPEYRQSSDYYYNVGRMAQSRGEAYLEQPPGPGIYTAQYEFVPGTVSGESIRLADVVLIFGSPEGFTCLQKKAIAGTSVCWLRLIFAGGQIEATAMFPGEACHGLPETAVRVIFYYAADAVDPAGQRIHWHGFAALSKYKACQTS